MHGHAAEDRKQNFKTVESKKVKSIHIYKLLPYNKLKSLSTQIHKFKWSNKFDFSRLPNN